MSKLNGKGRVHSSIPPMAEPLPSDETQPSIPRHKAIPPPPPPKGTKVQGTKVQRTAQALRVIWTAVKLIWRVWV